MERRLSINKRFHQVTFKAPVICIDEDKQFAELMQEINYGIKMLKKRKWNLADYWYHMAEFFDYIGLSADAEEHRDKAKTWVLGIPEKGERKTGYINVGRRDVGIIRSIEDCI